MHYVDELLALYPGKDRFAQKFFLAQLVDHTPDRYSDEIVEFLWGETRSEHSIVKRQARFTLGQFLPAYTGLGATAGRQRGPGGWVPGRLLDRRGRR